MVNKAPKPDPYAVFRAAVAARARWRCEAPWCRTAQPPLDVHHVVKRSKSGRTHPHQLREVVYLCRACHEDAEAHRLLIEPDGDRWAWRKA